MAGTGINWDDMGVTSNAGINWSDLASMTSANINWSDIAYLADNAQALVTNVNTILSTLTTLNTTINTDLPMILTKLDDILGAVASIEGLENLDDVVNELANLDLSQINEINVAAAAIEAALGSSTDTVTTTVFGALNGIESYVDTVEALIGASGDVESAETIFAELSKLATLQEAVNKAKSGAEAALGEVQSVRSEVGAKGATPNVYDRLKIINDAVAEVKIASEAISESQVETGNVAAQMLSKLSKFVGEASEAVGMGGPGGPGGGGGMGVTPLEADEASDIDKVHSKLAEINAKLEALREAVGTQDVVVKTWFEAGE